MDQKTVDAASAIEPSARKSRRRTDSTENNDFASTSPGSLEGAVTIPPIESLRTQEQPAATLPSDVSESKSDGEHGERRRRHGLAAAAGVVGEKISPGVEKLRHASNVMLEEASDDPSLRFLLIAAAIFVLTIFLFLLNRLLG